MVKIYEHESPEEIAKKIYDNFEVFASCSILGYWDIGNTKMHPKGDLVCDELKRLDRVDNTKPVRGKGDKLVRTRRKPSNSIGGYLAQKIFRYEKTEMAENPYIKYTIWRIQ